MTIQLNISLKEEDWVAAMGGWRCDALQIPGAQFEALYHDGIKADSKDVTVENYIIRWSGNSKPKNLLVTISLTEDLPKLEEEKFNLEKEKFNLEQKKVSIQNKWKVITTIGAVVSSSITFLGTYFLIPESKKSELLQPRIHTDTNVMSVSENQCINSLKNSFENYGLKNITPVKGGIYGIQEEYNIFVACSTDFKAIFIVVSGPKDSKAKRIREDIKQLLP
jgi:hypothetical protein